MTQVPRQEDNAGLSRTYAWIAQSAIAIETPYAAKLPVEQEDDFNQRSQQIQRLWDTDEHFRNHLILLRQIEFFMLEVLESDKPAFALLETEIGNLKLISDRRLADYFDKVRRFSEAYNRMHQYLFSEHVQLFFECWLSLGLGNERFNNPRARSSNGQYPQFEVFNGVLELIRRKAREKDFKQKLSRRKEVSSKRNRAAQSYLSRLFDKHSTMDVVRIDLFFKENLGIAMTADQAKVKFQRLLNNLRGKRTIFKNLAGYVWKLSWAPAKGFYFHVILLFAGSGTCHAEDMAQQVGEYWAQTICKGAGAFMNCNASIYPARKSGTGRVTAGDPKKMALDEVITYMANSDMFLRASTLGKGTGKLFGHGEI